MGEIVHRKVSRRKRRIRAFTLAEALVAAVILAIVSASATLPFVSGVQHVNEAARVELAVFLGQSLMEEILARPFFHPDHPNPSPGPDYAGQPRNLFDSIDDYHLYTESPGDLRNYNNLKFSVDGAEDFRRVVTVEYITFPHQAPSDTHCFVRICVRVYSGTDLMVELTRIASRED